MQWGYIRKANVQMIRRKCLALAGAGILFPAISRADTPIRLLHLGAAGLSNSVLHFADRQKFFDKHGANVQLVPVAGTAIPELSDDNPMGPIGAPGGLDGAWI